MSDLAKLNNSNSVDKAIIKSDRLKIGMTTTPDRHHFISTGQWMLLIITNAVCLTFVAFACILFKGTA